MPNIDDILEPILADLDACEADAQAAIAQRHFDGVGMGARFAMARICASLRPVLDQCNEALADLEVAQARTDEINERIREVLADSRAQIAKRDARIAELEKLVKAYAPVEGTSEP